MRADLNEDIRKLKEEGLSFRGIATALGVSHEAVRKRLKTVKYKDQMSTTAEDRKLTASTIKKEKVSTGSNPRKSRVCEQVRDAVNQVSTLWEARLISSQRARRRYFKGCFQMLVICSERSGSSW